MAYNEIMSRLEQMHKGDKVTLECVEDYSLHVTGLNRFNIHSLTPAPLRLEIECEVRRDLDVYGTVIGIDGDAIWVRWDSGDRSNVDRGALEVTRARPRR